MSSSSTAAPRQVPYRSQGSRRPASLLHRLAVFNALLASSLGLRFGQSRAGAIIAVAEPVGVVALFSLVHWLAPVDIPPYGPSTPLFYLTGIIPFYLMFQLSLRLRTWDRMQRLPGVSEFDLMLATVVAEILGKLAVLLICSWIIGWYDKVAVIPERPELCIAALAILAVQGVAIGILNAVIISYFYPWNYIYQVLMRAWIGFSGVTILIDYAPDYIRIIAKDIPITHAVLLYRMGEWSRFPNLLFDSLFLFLSSLGLALAAFLSERASRERRLNR